jgi:hypothetical protein
VTAPPLLPRLYVASSVRGSVLRWLLFLGLMEAWTLGVGFAGRTRHIPFAQQAWLVQLPLLGLLIPLVSTLGGVALYQRAMQVDGSERGALLDRALRWAQVGSGPVHSVLLASRGSAMLLAGDPTRALLIFVPLVESGWFRAFGRDRSVALLELARICIALGDLGGAEAWLQRAHEMGPPRRRALLVGTEALIKLRQGREREAAEHLENWLENRSGPESEWSHNLCVFLLHFAADHFGQAVEVPFDLEPFSHLALQWPSLRDFVARQHALRTKPEPRAKPLLN